MGKDKRHIDTYLTKEHAWQQTSKTKPQTARELEDRKEIRFKSTARCASTGDNRKIAGNT
jgi:hypothetical protein